MQISHDDWTKIRSELEQAKSLSPNRIIAAWSSMGAPFPPPSAYKQELMKLYAKHYGIDTLVETGTYLGQMVEACMDNFKTIHSIELSDELHARAKKKFARNRSVKLHKGDSGEMLAKVLKSLKKPAIFWLDAHYSEGITAKGILNTPILEELDGIFKHRIKGHVILVDDARIFTGKDDYPTTDQVRKLAAKSLKNHHFVNRYDIIRLQPDTADVEV